jgi:hypothetical protein
MACYHEHNDNSRLYQSSKFLTSGLHLGFIWVTSIESCTNVHDTTVLA